MYKVSVKGAAKANLKITLVDKNGSCAAFSNEPSGVLKVVDVKLWWPYMMHENPGYLYLCLLKLVNITLLCLIATK